MALSEVGDKQVTVSLPWSIKKWEKADSGEMTQKQTETVGKMCHRQSLDLSTHDIKVEVKSIWVHRITKRTDSSFIPTLAVIIGYEDELLKVVNIGFTRHKVSAYIPAPVRCKCQRFGHKAAGCIKQTNLDVHGVHSHIDTGMYGQPRPA